MYRTLFLVCPTDCLEPIVNNGFEGKKYFYSSLGNSFAYDKKTLNCMKQVVFKHSIESIYLVLSNKNQIMLDAFGGQFFSEIRGLKEFYSEINDQKVLLELLRHGDKDHWSFLSYFMNKKILRLQNALANFGNDRIKISALIYNRKENLFIGTNTNLISLEKHYLN